MGLDLLISVPIIIFSLIGFRDGLVKKLVAIIMMILGLVVAQTYRADVGRMIAEFLGIYNNTFVTLGFLVIFIGVVTLQALLYRILTANYKIGGVADRSLGGILGFVQGVIFISAILMVYSVEGVPSKQAKRDSRFYRLVVNIAPQILDATSGIVPEFKGRLDELTKPSEINMPRR